MSSFKEIHFVVRQTHTLNVGYEQVARSLAGEMKSRYKVKLKVVRSRQAASPNFFLSSFFQVVLSIRYFFACLSASFGSDILYVFGKEASLALVFLRLYPGLHIVAQIPHRYKRVDKKLTIYRLWERFQERMVIKCSDRVFVDSEFARSYFKEQYHQVPLLTSYGTNHIVRKKLMPMPKSLKESRQFGICMLPGNPELAKMALRSFAQYPKYDYYLLVPTTAKALREEIKKYEAYSHIHFLYHKEEYQKYLEKSSIYIHLEPTVLGRLSLLEAMKFSKQVICYKSSFSLKITAGEADYFQNHSQLLNCLQHAVRKTHFDRGALMKTFADKLNWEEIASLQMKSIESINKDSKAVSPVLFDRNSVQNSQ
ncbi:MAG: hypothetical protein AAF696_11295 [Bacteroidota bacterium]